MIYYDIDKKYPVEPGKFDIDEWGYHIIKSEFLLVPYNYQSEFHCFGDVKVKAFRILKLFAHDNSEIAAYHTGEILAYDNSKIVAYDLVTVWANDTSKVWAYDCVRLIANDNSKVWCYDFVSASDYRPYSLDYNHGEDENKNVTYY